MLKALYDYARQNDLVLPAGFVQKTVKAYICPQREPFWM